VNRWLFGAVLGLSVALGGGHGKGPAAEVAKGPVWWRDYARARAEAKRTGKPLFVVFRCEA
jgi:hypothetical protein